MVRPMGLCFSLFLFLAFFPGLLAQEFEAATIKVDGATIASETDANFICATLDWWPHDKCNYNRCPWGYSSVINLDLSHPLLAKAIEAFKHLRIRVGGSLQDQVLYDIGPLRSPCHPFRKMNDGLFGYSKGCLRMNRWDELNRLFRQTGAIVTFGLNALYGRHQIRKSVWGGTWDSTNTRNFMKYTVSKGYQVDSWEFGNELCGTGVGASVSAEQYGKDIINLKTIINVVYNNSQVKPLLVAPGGFYEENWFAKFLQVSGPRKVDVVTHHIYNLGAGVDPDLVNKILNPHYLSRIEETFKSLDRNIQTNGPWASAWVGESGGAYNSGGHLVSNTFVNSFWYLDQLGMSAKHHTKVYCRQTLIGGNYGLLNTTTFVPNPDYYSALLWHRLMGKGVLSVNSIASPFLRTYAHCSKEKAGITLLLINLSNQTRFQINVENSMNFNMAVEKTSMYRGSALLRGLKKSMSWMGSRADEQLSREEYHLTPKDGYLRSQTMLLNGIPLKLSDDGNIPNMEPVRLGLNSPIFINPLSIAFLSFPNFDAPACGNPPS